MPAGYASWFWSGRKPDGIRMFATTIAPGAELRPLEPWQAEEFAAHMDRARDHIRSRVGTLFVSDDVAGARVTLQSYADGAAQDGQRIYGIWLNGTLVGGVIFVNFSVANGTCELGCWLEPDAEGRGLITAACRALLSWAFEVRGVHRAEWHCRTDNPRSSAVAQRLGMSLDGVLRESWLRDGEFHDMQVWAVLDREWRVEQASQELSR